MSTGTIRRVDSSGDTVLAEWDNTDEDSVERARGVFDAESRGGGLMVRCDDGTDLSGEKVTSFDPEAGDILSVGHFAGG